MGHVLASSPACGYNYWRPPTTRQALFFGRTEAALWGSYPWKNIIAYVTIMGFCRRVLMRCWPICLNQALFRTERLVLGNGIFATTPSVASA